MTGLICQTARDNPTHDMRLPGRAQRIQIDSDPPHCTPVRLIAWGSASQESQEAPVSLEEKQGFYQT